MATFASGFPTFGALHWDADKNQLWVVCDNNCDGRSRVFEVNSNGSFALVADTPAPRAWPTSTTRASRSRRTASASAAASRSTGPTTATPAATRCEPAPSPARPRRRPSGAPAGRPPTTAKGDFNGDGFGDLAIGAPGENDGAGAVHVLYGSATGLSTTGSQFWSQDSAGIADTAEAGDDFGRSLAVGNFNGDGFNDLAIGAPGENIGAGTVHVLYGSASGLTATGSQQWTQASTGVGDDPEPGDHFGATLAAGNLDTSTVASELVIGAPDEDIGAWTDAGIVHVLCPASAPMRQMLRIEEGRISGSS